VGSFAFGNPVGVLDGNVLRVAARLLGEHEPVDRPAVRKRLQEQADRWAASTDSRSFNHGMMDLGAVVCTPARPGCLICPLEACCLARKAGAVHLIPRKSPKAARKTRYFHFYLVRDGSGGLLIRRRPDRGVWGGLWEIPNQEVDEAQWAQRGDPAGGRYLGIELKHAFTHFDMMIRVFEAGAAAAPPGDRYISQENIAIFAFSKAVLNIFGAVFSAPQPPPPAYG
jgi:A/G-specific adenine glycosylase